MTFLVVNVGQEGFSSEFLKEYNVEALLEVLQKRGWSEASFLYCGRRHGWCGSGFWVMTLPESSHFSFWLSLGGGGFFGWRVAAVKKCLNYVLDVRQPSGGW